MEERPLVYYGHPDTSVGEPKRVDAWNPATGRMHSRRLAHIVYVIRCGEFVKIGSSSNVEERVRVFECGNPHELRIVAKLPGGRAAEKLLQARFAEHLHRLEWYRIEGALAEWIEAGCPAGACDG